MTLPDLGTPAAFREHINWDHPDINERTKEGVQMELKAGPKEDHPEKLVHTIAAFANTLGGSIIVGVGEGGKKTGLTYADGLVPVTKGGDSLRGKMTKLIAARLDPSPPVRIHVLDIDEDGDTKQVVVLQVQPSVRIIGCRGQETGHGLRYLYRTEHGNQDMTPMEVEAHILNTTRARRLELERALATFSAVVITEHHRDLRGDGEAPLLSPGPQSRLHALSDFGLLVRPALTAAWWKEEHPPEPADWELASIPYEAIKLVVYGPTPDRVAEIHVAGRIERMRIPEYERGIAQPGYFYEFFPDLN